MRKRRGRSKTYGSNTWKPWHAGSAAHSSLQHSTLTPWRRTTLGIAHGSMPVVEETGQVGSIHDPCVEACVKPDGVATTQAGGEGVGFPAPTSATLLIRAVARVQ